MDADLSLIIATAFPVVVFGGCMALVAFVIGKELCGCDKLLVSLLAYTAAVHILIVRIKF